MTDLQLDVAIRLTLAALIGAAIGVERELREQAAGLRTHMLVSVGACLFALISAFGFEAMVAGRTSLGPERYDVSRVASQIVVGVGFLGAGTIIRHGLSVRGLTTAASLWVVAALGTAIGLGMYWASGVAAAITILSLIGLRTARNRLRMRGGVGYHRLILQVSREQALDAALDATREAGFHIRHLRLDEAEGMIEAQIGLSGQDDAVVQRLIQRLATLGGVIEVESGDSV